MSDLFKFTSPFWNIYSPYDIVKVIFIAFIVTVIFTPVSKAIAYRIGAIDVPKDSRRMHKKPTPRLGGLAIFFGTIAAMEASIKFSQGNRPYLFGILSGAVILVVMGIIDDCKALPAKLKLLVQIIAVAIPVYYGIRVEMISNPFVGANISSLPVWMSIVVTMVWIIGTTNAVNLIDGLDGLAAGTSLISSVFIGYIAFKTQQFEAFWMAMAVAGACLGFLPFNFNPAKIFMGDTGSTFLGYMLAIISVHGAVKGYATVIVLVPLLVLGLPIFDTTFAIMRRAFTGRPIMSPDRGHLHHRLVDNGLSQKQAVIVMYSISLILGILAVFAYRSITLRGILVLIAPFIMIAVAFMYVKVLSMKDDKVPEKQSSDEEKDDANKEESNTNL